MFSVFKIILYFFKVLAVLAILASIQVLKQQQVLKFPFVMGYYTFMLKAIVINLYWFCWKWRVDTITIMFSYKIIFKLAAVPSVAWDFLHYKHTNLM